MTREEYIAFMSDEKNEHHCSKCPENHGHDGWQWQYPCGQQNCWVTCHCREVPADAAEVDPEDFEWKKALMEKVMG